MDRFPGERLAEGALPEVDNWRTRHKREGASATGATRPIWADEDGAISIVGIDGSRRIVAVRFKGLATFALAFDTCEIFISDVGEDVSHDTIRHLIVDQIWPRIIADGGKLVLHASAVMTDRGAILFTGPSGRGKSTLAASLHRQGHTLLGDDAIVISETDGCAQCEAVYPSLRLYDDSLESLFDNAIGQSAVAHYTAKKNIHLSPIGREAGEHPIRAVFLIDEEDVAVPTVVPLRPADACMSLVEHSFWLDPNDRPLTALKLQSASRLAASVPVYVLSYPRDFARLSDVHAAIFAAVA